MFRFGQNLAWICLLSATFFPKAMSMPVEPFNLDKYRNECGGAVFPRCGGRWIGNSSTQETMFNHAYEYAKQEGKRILVISGHDWCMPCRHVVEKFIGSYAEPGVKAEVTANYIVVPIERDNWGSNTVLKKVGIPVSGFTEIAIFDPQINQTLQMIRFPQLLDSFISFKECKSSYLGEGKYYRYPVDDLSKSRREALLKNPEISLDKVVEDYNKKIEEDCPVGIYESPKN